MSYELNQLALELSEVMDQSGMYSTWRWYISPDATDTYEVTDEYGHSELLGHWEMIERLGDDYEPAALQVDDTYGDYYVECKGKMFNYFLWRVGCLDMECYGFTDNKAEAYNTLIEHVREYIEQC